LSPGILIAQDGADRPGDRPGEIPASDREINPNFVLPQPGIGFDRPSADREGGEPSGVIPGHLSGVMVRHKW